MDRHLSAKRLLTAWRDLITLPKPLLAAEAALEAVDYTQAPVVGINPATVTAANAEKIVNDLAVQISTEGAFAAARAKALDTVGAHVLRTALEVLPDVLADLEPRLQESVEVLSASLDLMPADSSAQGLVAAGPTAVQAFQQAKSAEADLDALDRFAASLSVIYGFQSPPELRLLTATTRESLQALLRAKDAKGTVRPLWVEGINNSDVSWTFNTPEQAREIRRVLDSLPPTEHKKPVFMKLGR